MKNDTTSYQISSDGTIVATEKKQCGHCGCYVDADAVFCSYCGNKLQAGTLHKNDNVREEQFFNIAIIGDDGHGKTTLKSAITKLLAKKGISGIKCYDSIESMVSQKKHIDAVILVCAATDGPEEQTRKHIRIARDMKINNIAVFINKCDLIDDDDLLELIIYNVQEVFSDCEYPNAYTIPFHYGSALEAVNGVVEEEDKILKLLSHLLE